MSLSNGTLAAVGFRTVMGFNMLMHGLVRLPDLAGFAGYLQSTFGDTILPGPLVTAFAYGLTFVEAAIGVALLACWQVRLTCLVSMATMISLIFGSSLVGEWGWVSTQTTYAAFFAGLLLLNDHDRPWTAVAAGLCQR